MGRDDERVKRYNRSATESRLCVPNRNSAECGNECQTSLKAIALSVIW